MSGKRKDTSLPAGLRWRGNIIWMRSVRLHNPFNESTKTANVREAKLALARRLAAKPEPTASPSRHVGGLAPLTVEQLAAWHAAEVARRSPGHQRGVNYAWRVGLVPFFSGQRMDALRPADLQQYLTSRVDDGEVSGNTISREIQFLRKALTHEAHHGKRLVAIPPKPSKRDFDLHVISASQAGSHIEDQDLVYLYDAVTPECRRHILMLLATGMRQGELRRVERAWFRREPKLVPSGGVLELPAWATKTRRPRVLLLPEWAYQAFVGGTLPHTYDAYRTMQRAAARVGLGEQVFAHDRSLRKTFASRAKEETRDPDAVDLWAGHKAREVAGRYQDLTEHRSYLVGRAINARFEAFLRTVEVAWEPWPDEGDWVVERLRRREAGAFGLRRNIAR